MYSTTVTVLPVVKLAGGAIDNGTSPGAAPPLPTTTPFFNNTKVALMVVLRTLTAACAGQIGSSNTGAGIVLTGDCGAVMTLWVHSVCIAVIDSPDVAFVT